MKIAFHRVELPLEHPFTIARGTKNVQRSLIVELEQDGASGYGEATENAYYRTTLDSLTQSIQRCAAEIEESGHTNALDLWGSLQSKLQEDPFALAAVDAAAHDLFGKLAGRSTFDMLGLTWEDIPQSSYTIGIDTIERMVEKLEARLGWPIFKIKLGTTEDVEIVRQLRQCTDAVFRVDANCGWTASQTVDYSVALRELGVEFIEQPLPAEAAAEEHRYVFENSVLPIVADESCLIESDVEKCLGSFHGVNVKLSKCGGITPAFRMLKQARTFGMKTMVGCMVESSVGISAAAQLLPLLDYADLDGAELLAGDAADGVAVRNGEIRSPNRFGNGVELLDSVLVTTEENLKNESTLA
ncbi:L-alanine-DL-glutamate epimerase [Neorhodopirellula lusitana]|uniref:Dipeptide epimerase n=1 Tax=Neorhodopirellula lusitana TaxID=445327 RepID=A0ABY1Q3E9_9BACT|nr:dipeptide epimerase [Neorhodopirellula lusitana]SMP56244.1 L-alanine-DL-glutamate epimerase [Neorhodopirellula lusitana]